MNMNRVVTEKVVKPGFPLAGNISTGERVTEKGKTYVKSHDYFTARGDNAMSFHNVYGEKPQNIMIKFFSDNLSTSCSEQIEYRNKQGKIFTFGNGQVFNYVENGKFVEKILWKDEENLTDGEKKIRKNEFAAFVKSRCDGGSFSHVLRMWFLVLGVFDVFASWKLVTHGALTSIPNIRDTFDLVQKEAGTVIGIPFILNVKFAVADRVDDKRKYPILTLMAKPGEKQKMDCLEYEGLKQLEATSENNN